MKERRPRKSKAKQFAVKEIPEAIRRKMDVRNHRHRVKNALDHVVRTGVQLDDIDDIELEVT